jgi:serine/threonine-protein kinase
MEMAQGEVEDPIVGTTIDGRYAIEKKIGEGGMGVVYLATHAIIGKKCALKVLRGELSHESEVGQRFVQEAKSAAAIGNDHIIEITDFGQLPDGSAYFVMEFLDGQALHDVLEETPKLEQARALNVMMQCCEALGAAHNSNIVHRDLKPDNIFLIKKGGRADFVKVLDFGIAKVASQSSRLTKTGMIFGTPQYMSPEQAAGTGVDARTDIYSLGIIMYEMLCGHVPFEADTFMGVLTKHLYEEPIPPRRLVPPVEMDNNMEAVLLKAIAKKPEKRYQSMQEFQLDLLAMSEGRTPEIVFDQMRDTAATTVPPPPPSDIVGASRRHRQREEATGSKPKWPIFAGIGAVAVIGAVVAVVMLGGGSDAPTAQAAPNDKPAVAVPDPIAEPNAEPPKDTVEAPLPVPEAKAAPIKVVSVPEGAALYHGDAFMGKLPFDLVRPSDGVAPEHYTIKLDGYEELDVVITAGTPERFELTLEKERRGTGKKKPSGAAGAGGTTSDPEEPTQIKVKKKKDSHTDLADPWG